MYTNRAICTRISEKRHIVDYVDKRLPRICVSGTRLIQISSTRDSYTIITHKLRYSFQIISSSFLHFISIPIPYRSIAFLIRSIAHTHTHIRLNQHSNGGSNIFRFPLCVYSPSSIDRSIDNSARNRPFGILSRIATVSQMDQIRNLLGARALQDTSDRW